MKLSITDTSKQENKWGLRHIIGTIGLLAATLSSIQNSCLGLSITEMARYYKKIDKIDTEACPYVQDNSTITQYFETGEFDWDEETQGLILGSYYWGHIVMNVPGGLMVQRWGVKWVLGFSMFLSSIGTLLTPLGARTFGPWGLICIRVVTGIGECPVYPALLLMLSNWTSLNERGKSTGFVFAGAYLGLFLANSLSGIIISYLGWTGVFYIFGAAGILWLIVWWILYYDTPLEHPFINEDERTYIIATSGKTYFKKLTRTPWIFILKSLPVWGLIIAHLGHNWCFFTVVSDLPKYLKTVLHVTVEENGFISGTPYLGMWLFTNFIGWLVDLMIVRFGWSTILVRKICITIAALGPAIGFIAASYSGCDKTFTTVSFFFGMTIMGAYTPGSRANALDISPNYGPTITALVSIGGGLIGVLAPYLIGVLTPNSTLQEWRLVFWISFTTIIGANIAYLIMGSAATQWWDDPGKVQTNNQGKEKTIEET